MTNKEKENLEKLLSLCGQVRTQITELLGTDFEEKEDLIVLEMKEKYTAKYLYGECQKLFPCWKSDYIDLSKVKSDRKGNYKVKFRKRIEADEEFKNLSADKLKEKGIKGITLEERLLMEIEYFKKTGKHLDIDNWTLCSGSRCVGGRVPRVCWLDVRMDVHWYNPDHSHDFLRARQSFPL